MSGEVQFNEEDSNTVTNIRIVRGAPTGILQWLIKTKIVKDGQAGERLLLIVAALAIVAAITIFFVSNNNEKGASQSQIQQKLLEAQQGTVSTSQ